MKFNRLFSAVALSGLLIASTACVDQDFSAKSPSSTTQQASKYKYVPNEVLIKFKSDRDGGRAASDVLAMIGANVVEKIETEAMLVENQRTGDEGELMLVNTKYETMEAIAMIKDMPNVEYAEPNFIYTLDATSNDPYFTNGSLWGMYGSNTSPANQFGCGAARAWTNNKVGSSTVYVGIIDEGYMYTHTDLAANAGTNPYEIAGNGVDDDRNGYIDDIYGWDFAGNNSSVFDGAADDHGTHCAGTIGARGGNGIGVAGVCWNVKMLGAKFLGASGGTSANAIKAVDYFTALKNRGLNIVATNNSWGGGGFSQALQDAITRAGNAGILFVAAAGNSGTNNDATPSYPASYPNANIIAVASITNTGARSSFSQYGATSVDLGAPGSGIWSTVPTSSGGSGYASYNGTSMATPHVTGAVALYKSINPSATASQIKSAILGSTIATSSLSGRCVTGGRLNVSNF